MIEDHGLALNEIVAPMVTLCAAQSWALEVPNADFVTPTDVAKTWARFRPYTFDGEKDTLSGGYRWADSGYAQIELMTPLNKGMRPGYSAASLVLRAYREHRTASGIIFRRVRIADGLEGSGRNKGWWVTPILADYEYDSL